MVGNIEGLYIRTLCSLTKTERDGEGQRKEYGLFALLKERDDFVQRLAVTSTARELGELIGEYKEELRDNFQGKKWRMNDDEAFPLIYELQGYGVAELGILNRHEKREFRKGYQQGTEVTGCAKRQDRLPWRQKRNS